MLYFKELRISPNGKSLIINAAVEDSDYFLNVYIDSIIIDTQDTYVSSGPSNSPIYAYTIPSNESKKEIKLELDMKTLGVDFDKTMFFVYIKSRGDASPAIPCGLVRDLIMGTTVNLRPIYTKALGYMKEMSKNCEVPRGFIDVILRAKALDLSIRTGNYVQAIKYWNRFFVHSVFNTTGSGCSCGYFK